MEMNDIRRFYEEQGRDFERALAEIRSGKKKTHWIWYIFPQLRALGRSRTACYYGIADLAEAERYFADELLRSRLLEITKALLDLPSQPPSWILGSVDSQKVFSCMTLFDAVAGEDYDAFRLVLDKFYDGKRDEATLQILNG